MFKLVWPSTAQDWKQRFTPTLFDQYLGQICVGGLKIQKFLIQFYCQLTWLMSKIIKCPTELWHDFP